MMIIPFMMTACAKANQVKQKFNLKSHHMKQKKLLMISNGMTENQKEYN